MRNIVNSLGNGATHISRFFSRTQLGGLLNYRKTNYDELNELDKIYEFYIRKKANKPEKANEKESSNLENISMIDILEIDWTKKEPKASHEQILKCFVFDNPSERGDLTTDCESLFKILNDAAEDRLKNTGGKNYEQVNSAIILFTAEFLQWLQFLAKRPCKMTVYEDVSNRIDYLEAILEKPIFPLETKSDFAIQSVIYSLIKLLEQKILPRIAWKAENDSAREFFDELMKHAEAHIRYSINGLFILYSASSDATKFDFVNYQEQLHGGIKLATDNFLGDTLKLLSGLRDALTPNQDKSKSLLEINFFLTDSGVLRKDLVILNHNPSTKRELGIHHILNKPNLIEGLLLQFGYLNDFGLLLQAFRQAYQLCGRGGDYLMYVQLCEESFNLLATYAEFTNRSQHNLNDIWMPVTMIYDTCFKEQTETTWRQHYLAAKRLFKLANQELHHCKKALMALLNNMEKANTLTYQDETKKEISNFQTMVKKIRNRIEHYNSIEVPSVNKTEFQTGILALSDVSSKLNVQQLTNITSNNNYQTIPFTTNDDKSIQALLERNRQILVRAKNNSANNTKQSISPTVIADNSIKDSKMDVERVIKK